ncbi:ankyrin repeat domain-containing protein [Nitrosomonas marina]|uniref:Ankyrin repeat-containing protein n=1 Tax=Nitrosomonas marina TaxID=917 RepID=A0A1H8AS55_9PROT|nr:ankyrin repeat domain-containing protein [Nitrosomonas marina]SEM72638.1 Ankyrin repeat-containing protein [Nitrosomonas marina]
MYSQFFKLYKNPFSQLIRQDSIYLPDSHQLVFNRLVESIAQSTGIVCLLGAAGVGKSTLIARAVKTVIQREPDICYKDLSVCVGMQELNQTAQHDFSGVIAAVQDDGENSAGDCSKTVYELDATDEIDAETLIKLLKTIAKRNVGKNQALLILAGRGGLEQSLNAALRTLDKNLFQGIHYLNAFSDVEVKNYIDHRFYVVQYTGESIFTESAVRTVAVLANGIPGYINTICGMALFQADRKQHQTVTDQEIAEAAELSLLEENDECSFLQGNIQEIVKPDPQPDPVYVPVSVQRHENFTKRSRNWFLFIYPGAVSAVVAITTVIAFQQFFVPQPGEQSNEAVVNAQSEIWVPVNELSRDGYHALNQHKVPTNYAAAGVTLNVVDADESGKKYQHQPNALRAERSDETVQTLLAQAASLEQNSHLTLPKDNNAIATYQQILEIQPNNIDAIQGIERIQHHFIHRAKQAISQSHWKTAQSNLIKAKQINPDHHAVDTLLADVRKQVQAMKAAMARALDQQELAARKRANARYQLNEKGIDFDLTNFFLLAEHGKTDLIGLFLDANMPVDAQDTSLGDTALMIAASYGHLDTVKLMLKRRADVNKQNRIGRTALMNAIVFEQYDIVFNLLDQSVDINVSDQNGSNALMFAVQKNQPAIVEILLGKGANIHTRNVLGQSALSIAQENNNFTIVSLLKTAYNMQ